MIDDFLIECKRSLAKTRESYVIFDQMENFHDLWIKNQLAEQINKSRNKSEIFELWERYKNLEKRTRL